MSRRAKAGHVQYMLRDIPEDLWARFNDRATAIGWAGRRALILQLIDDFAEGRIAPSVPPPSATREE